MIRRRTILQAGLALPVMPVLSACSPSGGKKMTGFYEEGIYLSGNFGPVGVESTITEMEITGSIPEELTGRFLRNGPNPLEKVNLPSYHWFTGDGMVHGIRLEDGRADWYRNRWVRSTHIVDAFG